MLIFIDYYMKQCMNVFFSKIYSMTVFNRLLIYKLAYHYLTFTLV